MANKEILIKDLYKSLIGAGLIESQKDFANKIDTTEASVSKALNGNESYITKGLLKKIRKAFPRVNENWQLTTGDNVTSVGDNNANGRDSKVVVGGGKAIEKLVEEIGKQRESKDAMFERLMQQQDRLISMLEQKYGSK